MFCLLIHINLYHTSVKKINKAAKLILKALTYLYINHGDKELS